ncbi:MoaD/ThiS family protein [Desulfoscipio geothermicus]|uniref:Ubiquitin Mut7-C domain-containing protein n=1 Tax=Desulfoscipio geothermicus DSM 3669 TaxID=1121426 RepID=A0A1I6DW64_9FIRM|nr:MoaD/ThiS family protein [Desulfoscipio geothermicus]SFR09693.1 hypothetical protein SAMN05660706_11929 [Desulfoscipio geothermicus DSM 3669]
MVARITVQFFTGLEKYAKSNSRTESVEIADNVRVEWLMDYYGFPKGVVGVIVVNNVLSDVHTVLGDGDVVTFYPIFGGG